MRALSLAAAGLLGPLPWCPAPDFPAEAEPPGVEETRIVLPVFRVPALDADCPIQALFVDVSDPAQAQLHVVLADEDHPLPPLDYLYDADRWWGIFELDTEFPFFWIDLEDDGGHRVADVETILYHTPDKPPVGPVYPDKITFDGTYSWFQPWNVPIAFHFSATFRPAAFEQVNGRPVIYLNTWNHLFSPDNNNPGMKLVEVADYPVYKGTRAELEALFEEVWSDFGLDL